MRKIIPKKRKDFITSGPSIDEPTYPKFHIGLEHLPEAKKWDIGKKYFVTLELEMSALNIDKKDKLSDATFDIKGIDPHKQKKDFKILHKD